MIHVLQTPIPDTELDLCFCKSVQFRSDRGGIQSQELIRNLLFVVPKPGTLTRTEHGV